MTEIQRLKKHLAKLDANNMSDFYRERLKIYCFLVSDNATIDGKPIPHGKERYFYTLPTTTPEGKKIVGKGFEIPALRAEYDQKTIDGFSIEEQDFIQDELTTIDEFCDGENITSVHLRSTVRAYKDYLQKQLERLSDATTEQPTTNPKTPKPPKIKKIKIPIKLLNALVRADYIKDKKHPYKWIKEGRNRKINVLALTDFIGLLGYNSTDANFINYNFTLEKKIGDNYFGRQSAGKQSSCFDELSDLVEKFGEK